MFPESVSTHSTDDAVVLASAGCRYTYPLDPGWSFLSECIVSWALMDILSFYIHYLVLGDLRVYR